MFTLLFEPFGSIVNFIQSGNEVQATINEDDGGSFNVNFNFILLM